MSLKLKRGGSVFLDACCLINLFATGRIEEVLHALPFRFAVSRYVIDHEILRVFAEGTSRRFRQLDLDLLTSSELLVVEDLASNDELAEFVRFATVLDDGEASICALAMTRGGAVATDDRKALRTLRERVPSAPTLQTPELIYRWVQACTVSRAEISRVLSAVRDQARFVPRKQAPHSDWWAEHLG